MKKQFIIILIVMALSVCLGCKKSSQFQDETVIFEENSNEILKSKEINHQADSIKCKLTYGVLLAIGRQEEEKSFTKAVVQSIRDQILELVNPEEFKKMISDRINDGFTTMKFFKPDKEDVPGWQIVFKGLQTSNPKVVGNMGVGPITILSRPPLLMILERDGIGSTYFSISRVNFNDGFLSLTKSVDTFFGPSFDSMFVGQCEEMR